MGKPLTKQELINELAEKSGQTKQDAIRFLDALTDIAYRETAENGFIIPGLCKFKVTRRRKGRRYNVATGKHFLIAAHDVLKIVPLKKAKLLITPPPPDLILEEVEPLKKDEVVASETSPLSAPAPSAMPAAAPPVAETPALSGSSNESGSVVFACPQCGISIMAEPEDRGKTGVCPQCESEIQIPASQASGTGVSAPVEEGAPARRQAVTEFVTFVCDACSQEIEAPLDMIGMKADCPSCGSPLQVPEKSAPQEPKTGLQEMPASGKQEHKSMTIRMDLSDFLS